MCLVNGFICTFCVVKLQVLHLELQYGSCIYDNVQHSALGEDKYFYMIGGKFREGVPIIDTVMHFLI